MISNVISIENMLDAYGEEATVELLSSFSCARDSIQKNEEVETFVKKNVIDFFKRKLAVTYLVFDDNSDFVGIYTLAHKAIDIPADRLTAKMKNKVKRYARLDEERQTYSVSAFLIAQFGKNYEGGKGRTVAGQELMESALNMLSTAQAIVSGGLIFLDCEKDNSTALELYAQNGFVPFGERVSESDGHRYIQLLKGF
ncbi:MAG: GNAT family acetyltransferase [Lachnospiraceae bacterium]|nr:GNAT family acetyltransferase [Lachnospiraceae bacterium]MBP3295069.1 GNAT family acetyltransferase [Lachnospiraceae bacterium]